MRRALAVLVAIAAVAEAGQPRRFVADTVRALAGAQGRGVAVSVDGSFRPVGVLTTMASFDEPLGLALAVAPDGAAYVGTGHPARVYRVRGEKKELIGEVPADQITALLLDPSGTLWAATAVPARLFRMAAGAAKLEQVAVLETGNLWDLAWFGGGLVGAAGNPGRVVRLGAKGFEKLFDVPDTHARCLTIAGNALVVGTSGKGLVLRWTGSGPAAVLADSSFTEIAALAAAPDGVVYAAALTGDPTLGKVPDKPAGGNGATATVTVSEAPTPAPQADKGPATSEILRILPNGATTTVYRFGKQLAGALEWADGRLAVGTGLDGEVWQVVDGVAAELDDVDAAQVVRLADGGRWLLTQGPVRLQRRGPEVRGTLTSPALDAAQPAAWGEASVQADLPGSASCTIRFRSGATGLPGETWSAWTGMQGCAAAKVTAPPARYLQWQVELAGERARVERVWIAYRQVNLAPEVKEFTVHEPGEVFLKIPPPSDRIVEVQHPDLSGIFTTLDDDAAERQVTLGKKYYRVGYQSLSWKVEDPNNDPLLFDVAVQPAERDVWWPVRLRLDTTVLAVDTTALPDGLYRFRLTASDEPANPESPATAQALSSFVTVDNTPPHVTVARDGATWVVTVADALSPIARVEWNRDADDWHALAAPDASVGGRTARFTIEAKPGRHLLAVRAFDDHHNRAVAAVEEAP